MKIEKVYHFNTFAEVNLINAVESLCQSNYSSYDYKFPEDVFKIILKDLHEFVKDADKESTTRIARAYYEALTDIVCTEVCEDV